MHGNQYLFVNFPVRKSWWDQSRSTTKTLQWEFLVSHQRLPAVFSTAERITTSVGKSETLEDWKEMFCFESIKTLKLSRCNDSSGRSLSEAFVFHQRESGFLNFSKLLELLLSFKLEPDWGSPDGAWWNACLLAFSQIVLRWSRGDYSPFAHRLFTGLFVVLPEGTARTAKYTAPSLINTFTCFN